ncbi:MAG: DUF1049 domain-containing protein [Inquilinus sp.]|nr:DUF1049 domain-containing protein [Inquilinus sp.]
MVSFAISNRETAELTLWPLPFALPVPVFSIGLVALTIGFFAGGFIAWWSGGHHRRLARRRRSRLAAVESELATLRARLGETEQAKAKEQEAARITAAADASDRAARREAAKPKPLAALDAS